MANLVLIVAWIVGLIATGFSTFLVYEFMIDWETTDPYSYSNSLSLTTDHYKLRLELDFDKKVIRGEQTLKMRTLSSFVRSAVLDIKGIDVHDVLFNGETPLDFRISRTKPEIGEALTISLPWLTSNEFELLIKYTTSNKASALSWLNPNQTSGGSMPYLYTQCETIHCRSIAPFQDTPAVKSTFEAKIISPKNIVVRASGNMTNEFDYDNYRITHFSSSIPIPSYLFAFVAGDIAEQKLGNRTFVIAEKKDLAAMAAKLTGLENALKIAEEILTPYVWGYYKIAIQPKSFPYSGMENPLLSFASQTLVAGSPSNIDNIIHEIAHSWAGNLFTHNSWLNVWIKEGFATLIERKITKKMYGDTYYRNFAQAGKEALDEAVKQISPSILTSLYPLSDEIYHPDEIVNTVQAEKGFQFLVYIEKLIGENFFADFIVNFIKEFEYKSLDHIDFEKFLISFIYDIFDSSTAKNIKNQIDFEAWITQPGMPPVDIDFTTSEYTSAIAMAEEYIINGGSRRPANYRDFNNYSFHLKFMFLDHFLKNTTRLTSNLISRIDSDYSLYYLENPDLKSLFMQMAVVTQYYPPPFRYPGEFVASTGRMDHIIPVYLRMAAVDKYAAQDIYRKEQYFYHPVARQEIELILGL